MKEPVFVYAPVFAMEDGRKMGGPVKLKAAHQGEALLGFGDKALGTEVLKTYLPSNLRLIEAGLLQAKFPVIKDEMQAVVFPDLDTFKMYSIDKENFPYGEFLHQLRSFFE